MQLDWGSGALFVSGSPPGNPFLSRGLRDGNQAEWILPNPTFTARTGVHGPSVHPQRVRMPPCRGIRGGGDSTGGACGGERQYYVCVRTCRKVCYAAPAPQEQNRYPFLAQKTAGGPETEMTHFRDADNGQDEPRNAPPSPTLPPLCEWGPLFAGNSKKIRRKMWTRAELRG